MKTIKSLGMQGFRLVIVKLLRLPSAEKAVLSYLEASRVLAFPVEFHDTDVAIRSFSIDSRTLREGELFVALPGGTSDGHDHVPSAFCAGASGALVECSQRERVLALLKKAGLKPRNLLCVPDPLQAMTALAKSYRSRLQVRMISVMGSVGKTTTKEFLSYLLRKKFSVIATTGNLNNHLGVPIMISRIGPEHDFAVMELGANHLGEIDRLAELVQPQAALLTPIGPAHLGEFGSLENIYRAKTEILHHLPAGVPLVIPDHDELLRTILQEQGRRFLLVGPSERADYRISDVRTDNARVYFRINGSFLFSFPGQAVFLALNASLAIAMAVSMGFPLGEMPSEWEDVSFASGRFRETILANGVNVIDDSYNASPLSFAQALETLSRIPSEGKKILVFADMLELGEDEVRYHRELGEKIMASGVDIAFGFGPRSLHTVEMIRSLEEKEARHFAGADELSKALKKILKPGDLVLFKGSRGMRVETVLNSIRDLSLLT